MNRETLLTEQIERERTYLAEREVGTDEYNASFERLCKLEDKLADLEKFKRESEVDKQRVAEDKQYKIACLGLDAAKFVIGGVVIPIVGLVCITATEKGCTFTGALKEYTRLFVPKKHI